MKSFKPAGETGSSATLLTLRRPFRARRPWASCSASLQGSRDRSHWDETRPDHAGELRDMPNTWLSRSLRPRPAYPRPLQRTASPGPHAGPTRPALTSSSPTRQGAAARATANQARLWRPPSLGLSLWSTGCRSGVLGRRSTGHDARWLGDVAVLARGRRLRPKLRRWLKQLRNELLRATWSKTSSRSRPWPF